MGLRCLLGHDFGDRQTEGNREDRGNEVVVTMHEFRECTRCGYRRTISENKEVKPRDGSPSGEELEEPKPMSQGFSSEGPEIEEMSAEEDDGEILEDDDDEPVRGHGEWPDSGMDGGDGDEGFAAWPDPKGEDEGFSAEPSDGRPVEDVEFTRGGLTPEARATEPGDEPDGGTIMNAAGAAEADDGGGASTSGIRRASSGPSPTEQQRASGIDTVVVCPECGNQAPSIGSSLRSGDICPECHQGYLVEREQ